MARVYNFSAGPSVLPEVVLKEAAEEMLDYKGTGMSVMEMSHRSKAFDNIIKEAEKDLRDLMNISKLKRMPDDAREKLRETLQRIINEGSGGLICIILSFFLSLT